MSILDNHLIKTFFGSGIHAGNPDVSCVYLSPCSRSCMALRILKAMEEPIMKGDLFIWTKDFSIRIATQTYDGESAFFVDNADRLHPYCLRLPDKFQERKKGCDHRAYEKRCTLCPYVEIKTDWINLKPTPEPEKCVFCGENLHHRPCKPKDPVDEKIVEHYLQCSILGCEKCIHYRQEKELISLAREGYEKKP